MLPDGAHLRSEDWTIFYLNQTARNAVAPVLSNSDSNNHNHHHTNSHTNGRKEASDRAGEKEEQGRHGEGSGLGELLFVLNCVRMKEDKSVRR